MCVYVCVLQNTSSAVEPAVVFLPNRQRERRGSRADDVRAAAAGLSIACPSHQLLLASTAGGRIGLRSLDVPRHEAHFRVRSRRRRWSVRVVHLVPIGVFRVRHCRCITFLARGTDAELQPPAGETSVLATLLTKFADLFAILISPARWSLEVSAAASTDLGALRARVFDTLMRQHSLQSVVRAAAREVAARIVQARPDDGTDSHVQWVLRPVERPLPALCVSMAFQAIGASGDRVAAAAGGCGCGLGADGCEWGCMPAGVPTDDAKADSKDRVPTDAELLWFATVVLTIPIVAQGPTFVRYWPAPGRDHRRNNRLSCRATCVCVGAATRHDALVGSLWRSGVVPHASCHPQSRRCCCGRRSNGVSCGEHHPAHDGTCKALGVAMARPHNVCAWVHWCVVVV